MGLRKVKPHTVFRDHKLNHQIISGLKEKKVLITGATGGIGSSLVRMFANEGATIGIHYHQNQKQAKSLLHDIEKDGVKAKCFQADLLSTNELSLVQEFIERFGGIDILINNAGGILGFKDFLELDESAWAETHRLNVQAPF
ncbi:MAG TPA: SDR family NAD(P)-dependent oxidoreductase, partial [Nitrospinaceae bacterium]|nr:SDR family NAD(P)-dependent oxidoreductase [Nitrospinaceae bacterium]